MVLSAMKSPWFTHLFSNAASKLGEMMGQGAVYTVSALLAYLREDCYPKTGQCFSHQVRRNMASFSPESGNGFPLSSREKLPIGDN
jgi:hypothetical protein